MSKRLYVGKLPMEARPEEVKAFFEGYGTMTDCRILTGFGFIEFESEKDADDVVRNFNGKAFMGSELIVEFAKESRPRRQYDDRGGGEYSSRFRGEGGGGFRGGGGGGGGGRGPKAPGIRLVVTGVSRDTSWQDLKDFARQAGNVTFADIDRDAPNTGVVEYATLKEAEGAIRDLDGKDIRGVSVRVAMDERRGGSSGGGGGGGGYSGGGGYRGGGGGRRDYGGYEGGGGGGRHRSRSPRRGGGYDDRRPRYDEERGERAERRPRYDEERGERGDRGGERGGDRGGDRGGRDDRRSDRY